MRRSRSTHWKQTVLYLEETIVICEGETISGALHARKPLTQGTAVLQQAALRNMLVCMSCPDGVPLRMAMGNA